MQQNTAKVNYHLEQVSLHLAAYIADPTSFNNARLMTAARVVCAIVPEHELMLLLNRAYADYAHKPNSTNFNVLNGAMFMHQQQRFNRRELYGLDSVH